MMKKPIREPCEGGRLPVRSIRTGQQNKHAEHTQTVNSDTLQKAAGSYLTPTATSTDTPQHRDSRAKERGGDEARRRGVHRGRGNGHKTRADQFCSVW